MAELTEACERFSNFRETIPPADSELRLRLIAALRQRLAHVCIAALEPDLIILDEFQRFRDILDGESEAAELARNLLEYEEAGHHARVLLLSATPYRMFSMYHEEDQDHYADFLRTCQFLFDDDGGRVQALEGALSRYRRSLVRAAEVGTGEEEVLAARKDVQDLLRSIMVRTERIGAGSENAMMMERSTPESVRAEDLFQARLVDGVARAVGARDPVEFWKSAPYLLNFMREGYDLKDRLRRAAPNPGPDLVEALKANRNALLPKRTVQRYRPIEPANGRLRALIRDTVDAGLWRLLWLPPSLPYLEPRGAYAHVDAPTKALVFSSWHVVPEAIAGLVSYEAERRMLEEDPHRPIYGELTRKVTRPIEFALREDRRAGMNNLLLLYPSPYLADIGDPLRWALRIGNGGPVAPEVVRAHVADAIREELLRSGIRLSAETRGSDPRWYWASLPLLDARHSEIAAWTRHPSGWRATRPGDDAADVGFDQHIETFIETDAADGLGPAPLDLPEVLADVALGSPAVCALRALQRIAPTASLAELLQGAAEIAQGFRTIFNLPETVGLLRSEEQTYWKLVLQHGIDGNLQAVLDEYTHVLVESLGLSEHTPAEISKGVATAILGAASIRTSRVKLDTLKVGRGGRQIRTGSFHMRSRFALRFGDLRDDTDAALSRAGDVRLAFNSPFRPFVLASTSVGQEGLDFHTYCHAVYHWNLPSNPVDLEQREGRVHRYKGHAVRKNIAQTYGLAAIPHAGDGDPWRALFDRAAAERRPGTSDLVPYWIFEQGDARVERRVPVLPFSREIPRFTQLKSSLALYRLAFGQPRQEDLVAFLRQHVNGDDAALPLNRWRISLEPPDVVLDEETVTEARTGDADSVGLEQVPPQVQPSRNGDDPARAPTAGSRSKFAGKRIVRAKPYQAGGNPRRPGSHGYRAFEQIPLGDRGIRFEELLAAIRQLPAKSSERYGAGGTNHIQWDLDHGHTYLIDDT
jgi:hypothetical protein